jgi:hypothetical protein
MLAARLRVRSRAVFLPVLFRPLRGLNDHPPGTPGVSPVSSGTRLSRVAGGRFPSAAHFPTWDRPGFRHNLPQAKLQTPHAARQRSTLTPSGARRNEPLPKTMSSSKVFVVTSLWPSSFSESFSSDPFLPPLAR